MRFLGDANAYVRGKMGLDWRKLFPSHPWSELGRWCNIQLLAHIRAIYLPVSYYVSPDYPDLCMYVQINFTRMKEVTVWQGGDKQMVLESDDTLGLKRRSQYTLGLDCFGLIELLTLPRQLRKRGPFKSRLLKVVGNGNIKNVKPVEHSYSDSYDFSWLTISKVQSTSPWREPVMYSRFAGQFWRGSSMVPYRVSVLNRNSFVDGAYCWVENQTGLRTGWKTSLPLPLVSSPGSAQSWQLLSRLPGRFSETPTLSWKRCGTLPRALT